MREAEKLGEAPIGRLLLSNTLHSSAALVAYGIYNITDMWIVSWGVNETAAGAVVFVSPVMMLLSAVSTTMGAGGGALLSRALGKRDTRNAAKIAANVFAVFWFFAILMTVAGLAFLDPMLRGMGVTEKLYPYARDYASVILAGAISSTAFSSLIRAEGAMGYALKIWLIPILVNLALDSLFVFVLGIGIRGAALATVLSQIVSVGMFIWFFFLRKDKSYEINKRSFRPDFGLIRDVIWLGLPSLMKQLLASVSMILMNRYLGAFGGEQAITSMGFAMKIQGFLAMPQSGIAQGMQPLLGYNDSRGQPERVRETIRKAGAMSFGYGLFAAGIAFLFRKKLLAVFTSDPAVIGLGSLCLIYVTATMALNTFCPLFITFHQAVGKAQRALTVLICSVSIKMLTMVAMANVWQKEGILWSFVAGDILVFIFVVMYHFFHTGGPVGNMTNRKGTEKG